MRSCESHVFLLIVLLGCVVPFCNGLLSPRDMAKMVRPLRKYDPNHTVVPNATLANAYWNFTLLLSDPQAGNKTYLDDMKMWQDDFKFWSGNLLFNYTQYAFPNTSEARHTATSLAADGNWIGATGGAFRHKNATDVQIDNITLGDYATEIWILTLKDTTFSWRVRRTYLKTFTQDCSRYPTLIMNTQHNVGRPVREQAQVPSVLDNSFQWNGTYGFNCRMGEIYPPNTGDTGYWSYTYTQKQSVTMLFSPADATVTSNVTFNSGGEVGYLSMAWPDYPGTGSGDTTMSIGVTSVPGPTLITAGTVHDVTYTLTIRPQVVTTAARLSLRTMNASFDNVVQKMSRLFNMWAGNMYGNSPASISCLHEMSFYTQIASIYDPEGGVNSELYQALRHQLTLFAEYGVTDDGWVYPRWQQFRYVVMAIHDQIPHFLLAYYHHAVYSGDKDFIRSVWPQLMKVMNYLLQNMLMERDGVATTPRATGLPYADSADNWFDIINFGGKDAIINAYAVTALNAYAEMAEWIGDLSTAAKLRLQHTRSVQAFNDHFWNDTIGMYSDWIDTANVRRNYFYGWQQALAIDPLSGLTTPQQKQRMVQQMDKFYKMIRKDFDKSKLLWCVPTNFLSVALWDSYWNGTLQDQQAYGHYENGACFMALMGLEIAARGFAGQGEEAMELFHRAIEQFKVNRMWGQHYDWINDPPGWEGWNGPDVLTDTLMMLVGVLRGVLQIQPTLLNGVVVHGVPPASLEGLQYSFVHLGKRVNVTVQGGQVTFQ